MMKTSARIAAGGSRIGTALLLRGGGCLSFLPARFARQWVDEGAMRAAAPDRFTFLDRFQVVGPRKERLPAVAVLAQCLGAHVRGLAT
jgi:hypothetical protein